MGKKGALPQGKKSLVLIYSLLNINDIWLTEILYVLSKENIKGCGFVGATRYGDDTCINVLNLEDYVVGDGCNFEVSKRQIDFKRNDES
ncbi:hypothetical protein QTP88_022503 [Uroleucon formosanum]